MRALHAPRHPVAQRRHRALAVEVLDGITAVANDGEEFDFVEHVAAPLPIAVIAWILGVPRADRELLFHWTNEVIGKDDPEFRRPGETPGQTIRRARMELHAYLGELIEQRRREPADDIVSELLAAEIDGQPLTETQLLSYCELIVEAGNETTRNAISGGLLASREHRDEWDRSSAPTPSSCPSAVEEMLRYVSPIIHFTRTAMEDAEVHGVPIREGDKLALFFASGEPRRRGVRRPVRVPGRSRPEPAPRRSASVRTSAWAPTWRGSRWRPCSATSSPASRGSR